MASLTSRLIDRVSIEAEAETPTCQGGFTSVWGSIGTAAAEVIGLSGGEAMRVGVERNVQQWRVTIRRRPDVTTQHRLKWLLTGGTTLEMAIKAAMPDPKMRREATLLVCESGAID